MASADVRKVFHAAEYDIYVLKRDCGFTFANLFDTMISAQLLGYPSGLALIERHSTEPQDEQRSTGQCGRCATASPCTPRRRHDLRRLADSLETQLRRARRPNGPEQEFEARCAARPVATCDAGHLRIKAPRRSDPTALAVARLYLMRGRARPKVDRPPPRAGQPHADGDPALQPSQQASSPGQRRRVDPAPPGREILAGVSRGYTPRRTAAEDRQRLPSA
jgi:ribonuclease D